MVNSDFIRSYDCFFCDRKASWWRIATGLEQVRCRHCGIYLVDMDSEMACWEHRFEIMKYLHRRKRYNLHDCCKIPYLGWADGIGELLGNYPYEFIKLDRLIRL